MANSGVMKVSVSNGQVAVPADARSPFGHGRPGQFVTELLLGVR